MNILLFATIQKIDIEPELLNQMEELETDILEVSSSTTSMGC